MDISFSDVLHFTLHRHRSHVHGINNFTSIKGRFESLQILAVGVSCFGLYLIRFVTHIYDFVKSFFSAKKNAVKDSGKKLGESVFIFLLSPVTSIVLIIRGILGAIFHPVVAIEYV